ncbi:hypothetical protein FHS09_000036 [Microbulbifer rhizosphaerae]|uniref:Uncharacterized protein n=1 Tax=Microbulbifer rhizosphaerae TaxID=1562603 RepID=A0A7W4W7R4_9GAMM|nr:hypothetical protein [Microbulbifer rhizosphaerae]
MHCGCKARGQILKEPEGECLSRIVFSDNCQMAGRKPNPLSLKAVKLELCASHPAVEPKAFFDALALYR